MLCGLELDLRPQDDLPLLEASLKVCSRPGCAEEANTRIEWIGIRGCKIVVVEDVLSLDAQDQTAALKVKV